MPLEIVRNDITKIPVDAVVNSAHPTPYVGGGVDRAIHVAAGPELIAERQKIGDIATGEAFLTPGFRLPAKYVIHTVGPVWQDGKHDERRLLARCYHNSLQLAAENGCASVAFPLISAGVFGCPAEIAIATAVQAIREFLADHEMTVYLVVFGGDAFRISGSLFRNVQNYLDENYVEKRQKEEYEGDEPDLRRRQALRAARADYDEEAFCEVAEEAAASPPRCQKRMRKKDRAAIAMPTLLGNVICGAPADAKQKKRSLSDLLDEVDDTFSEALIRLIDAKGKSDPEIYKRANVDRKHFSKIRNNPVYQPSKATALALAIALELNLDETKDFIGRAGYAISHSNKADIIVEYFIEREEYDIFTINETLFAFGQACLG